MGSSLEISTWLPCQLMPSTSWLLWGVFFSLSCFDTMATPHDVPVMTLHPWFACKPSTIDNLMFSHSKLSSVYTNMNEKCHGYEAYQLGWSTCVSLTPFFLTVDHDSFAQSSCFWGNVVNELLQDLPYPHLAISHVTDMGLGGGFRFTSTSTHCSQNCTWPLWGNKDLAILLC